MSKHNVTIILLLVSFNSFLACDVADNNVENDQIEYLHASTSETYISISEARENVDSFLHEFDALTKATNHRYIINQFSRGGFDSTKAEQEKEPLVYVFNFNDNQGYAIASGDSRMPAILCVTENGNLLENDMLDNPGEIAMLSIIDTDYRMAVGLPIENYEGLWISPEEYGYSSPLVTKAQGAYHDTSEWETLFTDGNLLSCSWHQHSPFNDSCPTKDGIHKLAGCVSIAVAQVMYYWGLNGTYEDLALDWNQMHLLQTGDETGIPSSTKQMVADLVRSLGKTNNLDVSYELSSSSADCDHIKRTFEHFGYSSGGTKKNYSISEVVSALSNGPVIAGGFSHKKVKKVLGITVSTSYSGGHEWVIDQHLVRRQYRYTFDGNNNLIDTEEIRQQLLHCCWGWMNGQSNGYYFAGNFDTNHGLVTRSDQDYYYQYKLDIHTNIHP